VLTGQVIVTLMLSHSVFWQKKFPHLLGKNSQFSFNKKIPWIFLVTTKLHFYRLATASKPPWFCGQHIGLQSLGTAV
jgi:hypothetical protein